LQTVNGFGVCTGEAFKRAICEHEVLHR
jgi:hypothetical protein